MAQQSCLIQLSFKVLDIAHIPSLESWFIADFQLKDSLLYSNLVPYELLWLLSLWRILESELGPQQKTPTVFPLLYFAISSNRSFHWGRPIKSLEFNAWYFSPIIFCQKESTTYYMTHRFGLNNPVLWQQFCLCRVLLPNHYDIKYEMATYYHNHL